MTSATSPVFCGLDFGTSNSTIGLVRGNEARLVAVEDGKAVTPSAIFFNFEDGSTRFGRKALADYIDGAEGRLMRALKSVLGTGLAHEKTRIKARQMAFTDIIGLFIRHLKQRAEAEAGHEITDVVLGRPVHFVDGNPAADRLAQDQLEAAARAQGFRHIAFQFEPIAAALDFESTLRDERLALIIDIGGGTSDFSIVRVSPERARKSDRATDILANVGVHIGGTDFDRLLSMARIMPHLGYRTMTAEGKRTLPTSYYFDLATWQSINWLYVPKTLHQLREVRYEAAEPHLVDRLIHIIEHRLGHLLASRVENAKIALTDADLAAVEVPVPEGGTGGRGLVVDISREHLGQAISGATTRVRDTVASALASAGLRPDQIGALFLTGGSTQIPFVKQAILELFPEVEVMEGDMFGSVGLGLARDAARRAFAQ